MNLKDFWNRANNFNDTDGLLYNFNNNYPIMEFWTPITEKSTPDVLPIYMVSDWGRIFDTNNNQFVYQYQDSNRGYLHVYLKTKTSCLIRSVHRIVMIEFVGFDPDPEKNQVDHMSGIKLNNSLYNLRWVTCQENIISAYNMGLMPSGEDSPISKLTNDQVRHVCEMMQQGLPREEIYSYLTSCGIQSPGSVFHSIYTRRSWSRVTDRYEFQNYDERNPVFTDDQIHFVCKCLEHNMNHGDIIRALGYNTENMDKSSILNLYTAISHIKKGYHFTEISSQYNIDRDFSKNVYTDEEVHQICDLLSRKANTRQILYELGYHADVNKNKAEYFRHMNALDRIKNRIGYTHITQYYDF